MNYNDPSEMNKLKSDFPVGIKIRLSYDYRENDHKQPEGVVVGYEYMYSLPALNIEWKDRKGTEQENGLYYRDNIEYIEKDNKKPEEIEVGDWVSFFVSDSNLNNTLIISQVMYINTTKDWKKEKEYVTLHGTRKADAFLEVRKPNARTD